MTTANPRVLRFHISAGVDVDALARELDGALLGPASLISMDLRDGYVPTYATADDIRAQEDLAEHFFGEVPFAERPDREPLWLNHNQLLAYVVRLHEAWEDWIDAAVTDGVIALADGPPLRASAIEYAAMLVDAPARPDPDFVVLNWVIGPVPCLIQEGPLAGVWLPERVDWDPYLRGVRLGEG